MTIKDAILRVKEFDGKIVTLEINEDIASILEAALDEYVNAHYYNPSRFKEVPWRVEEMEQWRPLLDFWIAKIVSKFEQEEE